MMQINTIKLTNFRNYLKRDFAFDSNVTLIQGNNGSGKSNILEAIGLLSTAKSFKARYDKDIISYGYDFCTINGIISSNQDNPVLEMQILARAENTNTATKKLKVNNLAKTQANFATKLTTVIFTPEDMTLLSGSPSERRRFLDTFLNQIDRNYHKSLDIYTKAIRHRNKLLECINETQNGEDQLYYWNNLILQNGQYIQRQRVKFFDESQQIFETFAKDLNKDHTTAKINYKQNHMSQERLDSHLQIEVAAKTTLIGPHRDDFSVEFNGHDINQFGSRGQQRSIVLALKLCEIEYIAKIKDERPVLLLDDIFSEFDKSHKDAVLDVVKKQQTIITSAEEVEHFEHLNAFVIRI